MSAVENFKNQNLKSEKNEEVKEFTDEENTKCGFWIFRGAKFQV